MGGGSNAEYIYTMEGMELDRASYMRDPAEPIDASKVSFKAMWEKAKAQGVTSEAVAKIEVDDDGSQFIISALRVRLKWKPDGTFDGD